MTQLRPSPGGLDGPNNALIQAFARLGDGLQLINAVRKVCAGGKYVSPSLAEKIAGDLSTDTHLPPHETLSDREYQIFCMIASGKTVSEIARELCLSQKTISTHRSRILDKMQLRTNAQLTFYAIQNHLIESCPFPNGEAKTM